MTTITRETEIETPEMVSYRVGFKMWQVTQDGRGLVVTDLHRRKTARVEPPAEWGDRWSWNLTDGGFYFRNGR